jgi:hypothetical protein
MLSVFRQTSTDPAFPAEVDFSLNDIWVSLPADSPDYQLAISHALDGGTASVQLTAGDVPVQIKVTFTAARPLTTTSTFSNTKITCGGTVYRERAYVYWQERDETATVTMDGAEFSASGTLTTTQATVIDR